MKEARMEKHLLDPQRLRKIPPQFSWIDQRLVREHYIERLSHAAAALYLFLLTVADAKGLSFYSERSIGRLLGMSAEGLEPGQNPNPRRRRRLPPRPPLAALPQSYGKLAELPGPDTHSQTRRSLLI
jgi:hypothetical protein